MEVDDHHLLLDTGGNSCISAHCFVAVWLLAQCPCPRGRPFWSVLGPSHRIHILNCAVPRRPAAPHAVFTEGTGLQSWLSRGLGAAGYRETQEQGCRGKDRAEPAPRQQTAPDGWVLA